MERFKPGRYRRRRQHSGHQTELANRNRGSERRIPRCSRHHFHRIEDCRRTAVLQRRFMHQRLSQFQFATQNHRWRRLGRTTGFFGSVGAAGAKNGNTAGAARSKSVLAGRDLVPLFSTTSPRATIRSRAKAVPPVVRPRVPARQGSLDIPPALAMTRPQAGARSTRTISLSNGRAISLSPQTPLRYPCNQAAPQPPPLASPRLTTSAEQCRSLVRFRAR